MADQRVNVAGLRELGLAMQNLSRDMATRVAAQAVAAGATVVKKSAKQKAPVAARAYVAQGGEMVGSKRKGRRLESDEVLVQPGNVPKNIVTRKVRRTSLTAEYVVGVRGGKKNGYASRIASLIERGTVKQSPRPFLGPALEGNVQGVSDAIAARLKARINKVTASS